ncbi:MAG TPA: Xaa-Pro peptidase family protein [Thermoleophilaceae bacterium]|nr:Xaa-Pro peptidase family protein [Thermoleophilaceae bacterium]
MSVAGAIEARTDRLVSLLDARELDSLLVTNLVNVRYLTGFTGTNGACVVTRDERLFVTDFRYLEQAADQVSGYESVKGERDLLADLAARLRGRAGFDDAEVSVRTHGKLGEHLAAGAELVPAAGLVEELREVKDEGELAAIREAAKLADSVYEALRERGLAGRTERDVARFAEQAMREGGAEGPSFPAIVAAGAHGAHPHAEPRDAEIPRDTLVVIDMGARLDGYCSDCTRTLATGELDGEAREVYEVVREAQGRALAAVAPGAGHSDLDAQARDLIESAGHGERFGHGLGHGVGLEVHEGPRLAKNAEGALKAGNVVTVEPGVYLPGRLGVRIEDLVAVSDAGHEVLTPFSKELVVAG